MGALGSMKAGNKRGKKKSDGKFKHRSFGGVEKVAAFEYRGWTIRVYSRKIGITIKRLMFSVVIRGPFPPFRLSVGNKTSKVYALSAAKQAVDQWYLEKGFIERGLDPRHALGNAEMREIAVDADDDGSPST